MIRHNTARILSTLMMVCLFALFAMPLGVQAQTSGGDGFGLIPCGNHVDSTGAVSDGCTFEDFLQLAKNLIRYLVLLSIPLAAIAFAWAGFLYVTSAGDTGKIGDAKEIFWKVLWGFIFVLTAWLIVYTITSLLGDGFSFLE